jgi:3-deoxy-D-manno-octulosonate 8-phosphate phosphatase (KDO 8-P phosphatase)
MLSPRRKNAAALYNVIYQMTLTSMFSMKLDQRLQPIQLILSDVDGVLTNGGISYDNQGIESKQFHVRDGLGIKLWQRVGHRFGVITARSSHIVKMRMSELGVEIVRQGLEDKLPVAMKIIEELRLNLSEVCYIGDDLADLPLMKRVGLAASVADGTAEVKNSAQLVTKASGGQGAVRELVETILKAQDRWTEIVKSYEQD